MQPLILGDVSQLRPLILGEVSQLQLQPLILGDVSQLQPLILGEVSQLQQQPQLRDVTSLPQLLPLCVFSLARLPLAQVGVSLALTHVDDVTSQPQQAQPLGVVFLPQQQLPSLSVSFQPLYLLLPRLYSSQQPPPFPQHCVLDESTRQLLLSDLGDDLFVPRLLQRCGADAAHPGERALLRLLQLLY